MSKYKYVNQFFGEEKAEKLRSSTVSIVGLRGSGSILAEIFVRAGINVRIIDKGRVYEEELLGQTLYDEDDINKFKAKQAKKKLELINSQVKVKAFHEELTKETIYLLDADVVIDCTSSKELSNMIGEYCLKQEIPFISLITNGDYVSLKVQKDKKVKEFEEKEPVGIVGPVNFFAAGLAATYATRILLGDVPKDSSFEVLKDL